MCWPANTVGAFFVAILLIDMFQKNYADLPYHAVYGVILTFLFWLLCSFIGESVSGGILIVPAVFLCVFLFTVWFINESIKNRGCCMDCGTKCKKGRLVKKSSSSNNSITGILTSTPIGQCNNTLTSTQV